MTRRSYAVPDTGRGYEAIELEMSGFRKLDGELSCLSLRLAGRER